MAGLKDYQISVYVANLGKYVEGVLQGAWITLPMPAERLQDTLKTEVGLGGRYEEYAIHDYEGGEGLLATVANPGEYESLTDLNLMCRAFEAREDDDPDVYEKVQTVRDDLDAVPRTPLQYANLALNSDEIPYHSYDAPSSAESKEAKYAWTAVNHGWASDAVRSNWGAPSYQCIVEEGSTDIHAALEDTMHRIIDARAATGDAVDVLRETMGAMPAASVGEDDGVSPIDLDLGYVLPGAVTSFAERAQACDPSDPLNMTDTAGSGLSK